MLFFFTLETKLWVAMKLFKSFKQTRAKVNTEGWRKGSTHPCTSPDNDSPLSVFAQLRSFVWNHGESKWQPLSVNSSSSGKFGTDTDPTHADVFISDCLLQSNRDPVLLTILISWLSLVICRWFQCLGWHIYVGHSFCCVCITCPGARTLI